MSLRISHLWGHFRRGRIHGGRLGLRSIVLRGRGIYGCAILVQGGYKVTDAVNKPADAEETAGEKIEDSHPGFPLHKLMHAEDSKEKADKKL